MSVHLRLKRALLCLTGVGMIACVLPGCGGFVTDDGILPLPAIHLVYPPPDLYGLAYEHVELRALNDEPFYAWYVPADNPRATVVLNHGALFNRSSYPAQIILFHDLGCNVMIADYRGFGESLGLATLDVVLPDANVSLAYARQRSAETTDRIVIYGVSMGTMPTLAQGAANPPNVVGIIVEGVVQQELLPTWGFQLLGIPPSPEAFTRIPTDLDPLVNVENVTLPKLFIHSRQDDLTPILGAERLFDLANEPKYFFVVTGIHGLSVYSDPNYAGAIGAFLDEVAPLSAPSS